MRNSTFDPITLQNTKDYGLQGIILIRDLVEDVFERLCRCPEAALW
jgi:hypothetical protein